MAWVAVASAVIGAGTSIYEGSKNRAAASAAANTANANAVNVSDVITQAQQAASTNLQNSISLERTYEPQVAALRDSTNTALNNLATGNTSGQQAQNALLQSIGSANPLLQASANSLMQQLGLGGKLDPQTQAAAAQAALQQGGSSGISGSGAGRGLVAKDLGLTSLSLLQNRQSAALSGGTALSNDYATRLGLANSVASQQTNQTLGLGSLLNNTALPSSGLDPGSIASLYVGQSNTASQNAYNQAAIQTQQNNAQLNSILGFTNTAAGLYGKSTQPNTNSTTQPPPVPETGFS